MGPIDLSAFHSISLRASSSWILKKFALISALVPSEQLILYLVHRLLEALLGVVLLSFDVWLIGVVELVWVDAVASCEKPRILR